MLRLIVGIVVAQIVVYMWGFLVWGFGPYGTMIWKHADDDVQAGKALLEHFPETGTYYVPGFHHQQEEVGRLFEQGPVAFVHMLQPTGRPAMDSSIMVQGFVLNLLVIVILAYLLYWLSPHLHTYSRRLRFCAIVGLAVMLLTDLGDVAWWQIDWQWKLYQGAYHFSFFLVAGLVLSAFVRSPAPKE